jgi:hypothetical protein
MVDATYLILYIPEEGLVEKSLWRSAVLGVHYLNRPS